MNNRLVIRLLSAAFCLMLLFSLPGCGGGEKPAPAPTPTVNPAVGNWEGEYSKFVGDSEARDTEDPFSLTLKEDGTGSFSRDGNTYRLTWTLEGEAFAMQETFLGITNDYTGILKDDALDLFNGDPEDIWTCEYVFHRGK